MKKIGNIICENRIKILILTLILLVPAFLGMKLTKINYDILVYLPEDIETIKGQNILSDEFNMGAFAVSIIDNMEANEIIELENKIKNVDGVAKVITAYNLIGTTIPLEILPEEIQDKLKKEDSDLMLITFSNSTSAEETLNAVKEIKKITNEKCKVGGMSAMVLDTMNLSETEIIIYIIIAVILCIIVLLISLDSYIVPFLLLINIGLSILFNLGTNIFLGEISYITKALVAVLQLGVTTDFSIFLYHAYENAKKENKTNIDAMSEAIHETFISVVGSSLTTIAGFLVLCTMKLTLGTDLGIVMAKGVLLGVISVLTIFPSLILVSEKPIEKTKHKSLMPKFAKISNLITKHYKVIFALFIILLIPAYLANSKIDVYYKLDKSLPNNLDSIIANEELKNSFGIVSPEIILVDKNLPKIDINNMIKEIEQTEGIDLVLSFSKLSQMGISEELLSENIISIFKSNNYEMILINSLYEIASDELNSQVESITKIIKKYDKNAILAGEGPLMKDLVTISDKDFKNVNNASILCIIIIMLFVLKSLSLPILLITVIEFAIFINMSIPYFSAIELPFVAPIVLGTIELGATIDYAILMTTTYMKKRNENKEKEEAIKETLNTCIGSILVSGLCFFGATFGVGIYSDLEMISSLCTLISRGAIISMTVVIFILPTILIIFDKIIMKTTLKTKKEEKMKNIRKISSVLIITLVCIYSVPLCALTKDETVYAKLNNDGSVKNIFVNEHLINKEELDELHDKTDLKNILNINGKETYKQNTNHITWNAKGNDIYYKGTTNKELPVSTKIKYYLNGEEKSLNEILGKSGNIKISLNFTNNDMHKVLINGKYEELYTPFVTMTGLIIKGENNKDINVNNGKVINNGIDYIVVGLSAPGLYESLKIEELKNLNKVEIEFNTSKFELPNIYSVITPKIIDKNDLKIFDKMNTLYSNVDKLKNGIDEIEKGSLALLEGTNTLKESSKALEEGIKSLANGVSSIKNGSLDLNEGINYLLKEIQKTKKEAQKLTSNEAQSLLETATKDALTQTGGTPISTLILENVNSLNQMKDTWTTVTNTVSKNNTMINNLSITEESKEANKAIIDLLNNYNSVLTATLPNTLLLTLEELEIGITKLQIGSVSLTKGTELLYNGVNALDKKLPELIDGISQINEGTEELNRGITKYNSEGITKIHTLVNTNIKASESKIKALINLGEEYKSFTMNNNDLEGETKFILNINGNKVKEKQILKKETKNDENIWTRFKNLFK